MDSFYITLPSNASMKVYPNNTQTEYTTQLKQAIELEGSYEVAMAQIHYSPNILVNIGYFYLIFQEHYKDHAPDAYSSAFPIIARNGSTIIELLEDLQKEMNLISKVVRAARAEAAFNKRSRGIFAQDFLTKINFDRVEYGNLKATPNQLFVYETESLKDGIKKSEYMIVCDTMNDDFLKEVIKYGNNAKITTTKWVKAGEDKRGDLHGFSVTEAELDALRTKGVKIKLVKKYDEEANAIFSNTKNWTKDQFISAGIKYSKYLDGYDDRVIFSVKKEKLKIELKTQPTVFGMGINGELARIFNILIKNPSSTSLLVPETIEIPYVEKAFAPVKFAYVYCDLVEPQLVGDSQVRAISVIPIRQIKPGDSDEIVTYFDNLQYVPVQAKYFSSINISIRDTQGQGILFNDPYSTTVVKLHFRRRESRKRHYELE